MFRHVNGRWIAATEIPSDKARYGSFYVLAEQAEQAVREIIEESQHAEPGTEARKIGDLYSSFMDEQRIEERGWSAIAGDLAEADAVTDLPSLLAALGRLERRGVSGSFQAFVDNDPGDPERYRVFLEQGGLGLPDESYYREEKFADVRAAYTAFLAKMFALAGVVADAERVMALETELATHHWTTSDRGTARPPTTRCSGRRS